MSEQLAKVGDVELCYETFGNRSDPALLLVMGLGTQMLAWREEFCQELVSRGFFVIRYDNRDVGRSTRFSGVKPPGAVELLRRKPRNAAYTLDDMADDGLGLLDALRIERAHVAGASMGGMIAQVMAVRHPERVLSLTSIMSTTGGRFVGLQSPRVIPYLLGRPPADEEQYIERARSLFDVIGSPGFEPDECVGDRTCKHVATVGDALGRVCAECAPIYARRATRTSSKYSPARRPVRRFTCRW